MSSYSRKAILLLGILLLLPLVALGQGTVRGRITSANPNAPITAATILVRGTDPLVYTTMGEDGTFELLTPIGRHTIEVRSIGFLSRELSVTVLPTKETVLDVELEPLDVVLGEVVVSAPYDKSKTLDPLSFAGGRSFSTDETYRFASSLGDPARMVRSFAGVMPANDSRNDIIIRGNSPIGLQWVLDGIEVPNLNHFNAGIGLTGGQVSMINTNLLTNSDFHLSAWPAPFGNALSGIFDLTMRPGNTAHHEGWLQTGYGGLELGFEGPIPVGSESNYLVSYRYSVPRIMSGLKLMKLPAVPEYQDLTTKVTLHADDRHSLSLITLWGKSFIKINTDMLVTSEDGMIDIEDDGALDSYNQLIDEGSSNLIIGLTHDARWSKQVQQRTTLSLVRTALDLDVRKQLKESGELTDNYEQVMRDTSKEIKYSLHTDLTWHPDLSSLVVAGATGDLYRVDYHADIPIATEAGMVSEQGRFGVVRLYGQYRYKPSRRWALTAGLHGMTTTLNIYKTLEPRLGLMYEPAPSHILGLAGGLYSQLQPRTFYFARIPGSGEETNRDLKPSRAWHADAYYDWAFATDWHLKVEGYYQHLFDIPVQQDPTSAWSMLNVGVTDDNSIVPLPSLVNRGTGRNVGVELTLEKFISKDYYLLTNATLFSSTYTTGASSKRWHTAMDGGYILNLTGGGEYALSKSWTLTADLKRTVAGGLRYTPLLREQSAAEKRPVLDAERSNTLRMKPYFRTDIKLGFRHPGRRITEEFGLDLQNVTNYRNVMAMTYNERTNDYTAMRLQGFGIMATWRISFTVR